MAAFDQRRTITSWGRVKRHAAAVARPSFRDEIPALLHTTEAGSVLGVGLGRSYGDSGLNRGGRHVDMTGVDRIMVFDKTTGVLRAEAGLTVSDLLRITVPAGFFLPTTPGTRFVTLGGAVANDVHGKNHHRAGTLGCALTRLGLYRSDLGAVEIAPDQHGALFNATIGGLGLTGLITWVELTLQPIRSGYLAAETIPFGGYQEFLALADASAQDWEHTVAWIDCTGGAGGTGSRGLFTRANWLADGALDAHDDQTLASLPLELPAVVMNPFSIKVFNSLYFAAGARRQQARRVHYAPFFYPLDAVRNWNKAYGRRGFYQYQCVVPPAAADRAIPEMLAEIARSGQGSCLAVLKTFGTRRSPGLLSFPFEGVTLALDFPNRAARTYALFDRLDAIVMAAKGRLYPAKDGRMPAQMFRDGYPELDQFAAHVDPKFQSDFWRRTMT